MQAPPAPAHPSEPQQGLDEVERALSTLAGRHPDHERARRETLAAAEERRAAIEREAAARTRQRVKRALVVVANLAALTIAAAVAWRYYERTRALKAAIASAAAPLVGRGFTLVASNDLTASARIEWDAPASSCFVAATSSSSGALHTIAGLTQREGARSVSWCSCAPAHVIVEARGFDAGAGGLALLRIDARVFGGPLARAWSDAAPTGGDECAEQTLDAWIGDGRWPKPPIDDGWFSAKPERASLRRAGFHVVSGIAASRPFGVIDLAAGECALAVAETRTDELSLLSTGGARALRDAEGAMAWCDTKGGRSTVWREGGAPVAILSIVGARAGGMLGLREAAQMAGVTIAPRAALLRDEDLAWEATSVLRASAVPDVESSQVPAVPDVKRGRARIVAIAPARDVVVARQPADVNVACDPPLDARPRAWASVCAQSIAVSWWRRNDAPAAMAFAPLPFWLSAFEPHSEIDALARIPRLLALARRLVREGFEPSVVDGVVELADGVRVAGRAGEDAIVAVGLGQEAPWTSPCTDAAPWSLDDAPRVVPLAAGQRIKLTCSPGPRTPLGRRRTIVFRHVANQTL